MIDTTPRGLARLARPSIAMDEDRRLRVLLIDDDSSMREIVSCLLVSFGYHCQTAADGVTGLARFDDGGWNLVLTDLSMPGMNGWAVADAIRRRSPTMPIVLLTGMTSPEVLRHAGERGLPVVSKPFRAEALRAAVANALQASAPTPATGSDRDIETVANDWTSRSGGQHFSWRPR